MAAVQAFTTSLAAVPTLCATTFFPADGILNLGLGVAPLTLTEPAVYEGPCPTLMPRDDPSDPDPELPSTEDIIDDSSLSQHDDDGQRAQSNFREPFYTSPFPIAYALAATTITAYMLVIMLLITPRSFLDGGIVYLGRRGFTNSAASGVNIGGRPWLQKVAALTVAMSLTVATADTFSAAQEQWEMGISNSELLRRDVMGSTELKVIRLVSDTFLWLAQAQTLIRLFPRQKEKIIIKWAAFALITLDVIFSAINSFTYSTEDGVTRDGNPNDFASPIPALSYIFQLSLGALYAAWVMYYAVVRRKYAFYHPLMRNICLVAIISMVAILIPIVFFILDISEPNIAGWGDYVRWVGAAAASVVVWEWVERIEALEREDKKDGILGREVFDDELDFTSSRYLKRHKSSRDESSSGSGEGENDGDGNGHDQPRQPRQTGITWAGSIGNRPRQRPDNNPSTDGQQRPTDVIAATRQQFWPSRPAPTFTPVSRTDTTSAASTVYAVRFAEGERRYTPDAVMQQTPGEFPRHESIGRSSQHTSDDTTSSAPAHHAPDSPASATRDRVIETPAARQTADIEAMETGMANRGSGWRSLGLPGGPVFQRASIDAPPAAVAKHAVSAQPKVTPSAPRSRPLTGRWDLAGRLEEFAANQAEKIRDKVRPQTNTDDLPVLRIPAPARSGAALQQVLEEEEMQQTQSQEQRATSSSSSGPSPRQQYARRDHSTQGGSDDRPNLSRSRSEHSTVSHGGPEAPIPPNNPPLWPGVQSRYTYDDDTDDDDGFTDDESLSERLSTHAGQTGHRQSPGNASAPSGASSRDRR
jgi:hypothetical protein